MKPDDREELFRQGFEAYESGDLEAAFATYSSDIEATAPDWMNAGVLRGHDAFVEWTASWREAWDSWEQQLLEVRAVGERHVAARIRVRGRGKGSGLELDQEVGHVVEVDDEDRASYLEITMSFERAIEVAQQREVSN